MKTRALSFIVLSLSTFAAGWWLRGATRARDFVAAAVISPVDAAGRPALGNSPGLPTKRPRAAVEEFTAEDHRREAEDRSRMAARCRSALERRIAEWARLLDLGDGEVAALRQAVGPLVAATDPPVAELALPVLEERLRAMIDGERQAGIDQLASRRGEGLLRAKVQARLAELNAVLLLDPAQERALGELLLERGAQLPDPVAARTADLPPADLAEITRRLAEAGDDGSGFSSVAGNVVREGIEAEIRLLEGMLAADQVESYRAYLEEKHARWLPAAP